MTIKGGDQPQVGGFLGGEAKGPNKTCRLQAFPPRVRNGSGTSVWRRPQAAEQPLWGRKAEPCLQGAAWPLLDFHTDTDGAEQAALRFMALTELLGEGISSGPPTVVSRLVTDVAPPEWAEAADGGPKWASSVPDERRAEREGQ